MEKLPPYLSKISEDTRTARQASSDPVQFFKKQLLSSTVATNGSLTLPLDLFHRISMDIKPTYQKATEGEAFEKVSLYEMQNNLYQEQIVSVYKAWRKKYPALRLNYKSEIIVAWGAIESYLEHHTFPTTADSISLQQAFYLPYDVYMCFIQEVAKTMIEKSSLHGEWSTLQQVFVRVIPTHQRNNPIIMDIFRDIQKRYCSLELLSSDLTVLYQALRIIRLIYDSQEFSHTVDQYPTSSFRRSRDGFANTLGIAERTVRDFYILSQKRTINYESKTLAERELASNTDNISL